MKKVFWVMVLALLYVLGNQLAPVIAQDDDNFTAGAPGSSAIVGQGAGTFVLNPPQVGDTVIFQGQERVIDNVTGDFELVRAVIGSIGVVDPDEVPASFVSLVPITDSDAFPGAVEFVIGSEAEYGEYVVAIEVSFEDDGDETTPDTGYVFIVYFNFQGGMDGFFPGLD